MPDLRKLLEQADAALRGGALPRSLELLHEAEELYPDTVEVLARLGRVHIFRFLYPEAIAILRRAEALEPTNDAVLYDLGVALRFEGEVEEALRVHERMLEAHPGSRHARFAVALTRAVMGFADEALPEMEALVRESPGEAKTRLGLARSLIRLGRFTEALGHLDTLLRAEPHFVDALLYQSEALRHLQRLKDWVGIARRAFQVAPDGPFTRHQMHLVCMAEGDAQEALEHVRRALAMHPGFAEARVALGNLLWHAGALDEAQAALERAATQVPWNGQAVGMLAHFQVATGRGEPRLEPLEQAARIRPYAGLPYQLGRLYFETLKDLSGAERMLKLTLEHGPEWVDARRMLAETYMRQDRAAEALGHWRRITELSPEWGVAWKGLAFCLAHEANWDEALQACTRAARLLPKDADVQSLLTRLHSHRPGT